MSALPCPAWCTYGHDSPGARELESATGHRDHGRRTFETTDELGELVVVEVIQVDDLDVGERGPIQVYAGVGALPLTVALDYAAAVTTAVRLALEYAAPGDGPRPAAGRALRAA